jgi:hypothetical protein
MPSHAPADSHSLRSAYTGHALHHITHSLTRHASDFNKHTNSESLGVSEAGQARQPASTRANRQTGMNATPRPARTSTHWTSLPAQSRTVPETLYKHPCLEITGGVKRAIDHRSHVDRESGASLAPYVYSCTVSMYTSGYVTSALLYLPYLILQPKTQSVPFIKRSEGGLPAC